MAALDDRVPALLGRLGADRHAALRRASRDTPQVKRFVMRGHGIRHVAQRDRVKHNPSPFTDDKVDSTESNQLLGQMPGPTNVLFATVAPTMLQLPTCPWRLDGISEELSDCSSAGPNEHRSDVAFGHGILSCPVLSHDPSDVLICMSVRPSVCPSIHTPVDLRVGALCDTYVNIV